MIVIERLIAALEIEAEKIEVHAQRLVKIAASLQNKKHRRETLKIAMEEAAKARTSRRQVESLGNHLRGGKAAFRLSFSQRPLLATRYRV
jgi:hypothetical protein